MAIVWPAGATSPVGLIGAGRSGELATIDAVRSRGHEEMPARGVLSVTVPGTVEAWGRLLERFGSVGFGAVLEPAAALARDGYVISPDLSEHLRRAAELLLREEPLTPSTHRWRRGCCCATRTSRRCSSDIARAGINGFYRGEIAAAIVAAIKRRDGLVTAQDLATHHSQWVDPIAFPYRDVVIYELPPPTVGPDRPRHLSRSAAGRPGQDFRAARDGRAMRSGTRYITDPDFSAAPAGSLPRSPSRGRRAARSHTPSAVTRSTSARPTSTGNLVSLIQSVAYDFGSGIVAEGTGMLLQNRGAYFKLDPAHVNRLEPKKRTMHTLIPAMASRDGQPWAPSGRWEAMASRSCRRRCSPPGQPRARSIGSGRAAAKSGPRRWRDAGRGSRLSGRRRDGTRRRPRQADAGQAPLVRPRPRDRDRRARAVARGGGSAFRRLGRVADSPVYPGFGHPGNFGQSGLSGRTGLRRRFWLTRIIRFGLAVENGVKGKLIAEHKRADKDTGSPEVQIALPPHASGSSPST